MVLEEKALDAAGKAGGESAAGAEIGPLHVVPITVKENLDVVGTPTAHGIVLLKAPCRSRTFRSSRTCGNLARTRSDKPIFPTSGCAALVRSRAFLGRGMEVAGLPVVFLGLAFGRLPLPSLGPGFRPQGLFLGFRELPLAPLETVVRFPGQLTFSAMLNGARGGRQPPRLWTSGRA